MSYSYLEAETFWVLLAVANSFVVLVQLSETLPSKVIMKVF